MSDVTDMIRSYKTENADQRAPAPPGIQNVLRGALPPNNHLQAAHTTNYRPGFDNQPYNHPGAPGHSVSQPVHGHRGVSVKIIINF